MLSTPAAPRELLRLPEVKRRTGLSTTGIYVAMQTGRFPKSVKLGNGTAVAWASDEVQAWIEQRIAARAVR
jgi:prophage regulatory protein